MLKKKKSSTQFDHEHLKQLLHLDIQVQNPSKSEILDQIKQESQNQETNQETNQNQYANIKVFNYKHNYLNKQRGSSNLSQAKDSQDQSQQWIEVKKEQELRKKQEIKKLIHRKMAVGGGFTFDMTDFFKFKSQRKIQSSEDQDHFQPLNKGHLAWIILVYFVCNSAIIPAWIMSIKANKILRISWRFMLQTIFMIPFVLYQKRTGNQSVKNKYKYDYIFTLQGLRKVYISSLGTSIWFTIILSCFQWTYISHSLVLGSLSNFFLSLNRSIKHATHQLEPGGQIFVLFGLIFVLADSYLLNSQDQPESAWNAINPFYLKREPIQRVIADIAALSGAFILSRFSQMSVDLKSYYPPFLSMFLVNISVAFHVGLSAYFINGATFDLNTNFGVWGIFTGTHFAGFFYMAVILSFGMYISFTIISKLFADPIIPALAMTLQPFFATFFLGLVSVQTMPGSFSIFGYIFLICGLFLILIGQHLLQRRRQKQAKQKKIDKQIQQKIIKLHKIDQQKMQIPEQQKAHKYHINVFEHKIPKQKIQHGYSDIVHI